MSKEQRVIDREYIQTKSLIYIGKESDNPRLIEIFKKVFRRFCLIDSYEDIDNILNQYDIILCNETEDSLVYLQEIRKLDKKNIPFIIIENEQYESNPVIYIKDNLSQYVKLTPTHTEMMYIIQHELQNHDKELENIYLQEEQKAYLEMLDNTVIVSRTDLDGKITYANDIFCMVSKYTREELVGSLYSILRHPEHSASFFKELWETISEGKIWKGLIKNKDKEGETYITNTTIAPYYAKGEKVGYIAIRYVVTDDLMEKRNLKKYLTKLIINNKQLIKEKDEEIETLKSKNRMVDTISYAWLSEKEKKEKIKLQVETFEMKLKATVIQHEKRVEAYLQERRECSEVIQNKDKEIEILNDKIKNVKMQHSECEEALLNADKKNMLLQNRIADLEDILEHREEQLTKLQA